MSSKFLREFVMAVLSEGATSKQTVLISPELMTLEVALSNLRNRRILTKTGKITKSKNRYRVSVTYRGSLKKLKLALSNFYGRYVTVGK